MRERAGISRCVTVRFLLSVQRGDGSWPAFSGDDDGSWTTALAALTLSRVSVDSRAREKATAWLPDTKGREAHRLWRWKFKTADAQAGSWYCGQGKLAERTGDYGPTIHLFRLYEDKLGKGEEMVDRLSKLVAIFNSPDLDFRDNRADGDDLLGDAYEYPMRNFATESGKSKGQFYTPAEVARVIAKVLGVSGATRSNQAAIYDATCGSGSLLLKAHDEAKCVFRGNPNTIPG